MGTRIKSAHSFGIGDLSIGQLLTYLWAENILAWGHRTCDLSLSAPLVPKTTRSWSGFTWDCGQLLYPIFLIIVCLSVFIPVYIYALCSGNWLTNNPRHLRLLSLSPLGVIDLILNFWVSSFAFSCANILVYAELSYGIIGLVSQIILFLYTHIWQS